MKRRLSSLLVGGMIGAGLMVSPHALAVPRANPDPGVYNITGVWGGTTKLCLRYRNVNGFESLVAWPGCTDDKEANSQWTLTSTGQLQITGGENGKTVCLDSNAANEESFPGLGLAPCGDSASQQWDYDADAKTLKPSGSSECLTWPSGQHADVLPSLLSSSGCGTQNAATVLEPV